MVGSPKGISLIVCCYNSKDRIEKTIEFLVSQQLSNGVQWEIIIVDNASTDDTFAVAQNKLQGLFPESKFSVVKEPIPGLSYARKKGIEVAKYDYVLLCDDDNWLSPTYAQQVFDLFEAKSDMGVVSGKGIGVLAIKAPVWFQRMQRSYAVGEQAPKSMELKSVWGAGMGIRKEAYCRLMSLGFRHLNTDRIKDKLAGGGDTEICLAINRLGYKIWYEENLIFQHFVPADRINIDYANRLGYYIGYVSPTFSAYNEAFSSEREPFWENYWILKIGKSILQLVSLVLRPADSAFFKDENGVVKYFFIHSQRGKIIRQSELRGEYFNIVEEIRNAAWNLKSVN